MMHPVCLLQNLLAIPQMWKKAWVWACMAVVAYCNPMTVCVSSHSKPFTSCIKGDPDSFGGIEVRIWREAAALSGFSENSAWTFACYPFDAMIQSLAGNSSECDVGIGAIAITEQRIRQGLLFSWSYYSSSLAILVRNSSPSGFLFFSTFSWNLWLAIFMTIIIVPLLLWILEMAGSGQFERWSPMTFADSFRQSALAMMGTIDGSFLPKSQCLQIMLIPIAFMALVLTSVFTADLSSMLTVARTSGIRHIGDIITGRGIRVASNYAPQLKDRFGIVASPLHSLENAVNRVVTGALDAVISDRLFLLRASVDTGCTTHTLDDEFSAFQLAFAYIYTVSGQMQIVSDALVQVVERGDVGFLFTDEERMKCGTFDATEIQFSDVYGLFVILASFFGIALACTIVRRVASSMFQLREEVVPVIIDC